MNADSQCILHTGFYRMGEEGNLLISVICLYIVQLQINVFNIGMTTVCAFVCERVCLFTLALLALTFVAPQRSVCESADRGSKGFELVARGQLAPYE